MRSVAVRSFFSVAPRTRCAVSNALDIETEQLRPNNASQNSVNMSQKIESCRNGDVLVVARLDRLGRPLRELIDLVGELEGRGVEFRSLEESLDTTTAGGRLIFHVFGALAEFERKIIRERTMAGLESARAQS